MRKLDRIAPDSLLTNPRADFASWSRFERFVLNAFRDHPKPTSFKPTTMSPSSVASKMRDAIRGCLAFKYPITDTTIHHDDLAHWYDKIIIKHDKEFVYIGTPAEVRATLLGETVTTKSPTPSLIFDELTLCETAAFLLLLSFNRIVGPVLIRHPSFDLSTLPKYPNVEHFIRPDGALALI